MTRPGRTNFGFASFSHTLILLAIALFAWSGQAAAVIANCEIQTSGAGFQSGVTNSQLTYTISINELSPGGCGSGVSGSIALNGSDTTGGTTIQSSWSGTAGTPVNVTVTLGPDPGGQADFDVTCTSGCDGNTLIQWTARTLDAWQLTATTAQSFTVGIGDIVTLGVQYTYNNAGAGLDTDWVVDNPNGNVFFPTRPVDSGGNATNSFNSYTPGTYTVTVSGTCPTPAAPTPNCPPTPVSYTIVVEDPVLTPIQPPGGAATVPQNSAVTLEVKYASTNVVVDDVDINWSVLSEPSAGAGDFTGGTGSTPDTIVTTTAADGTTQVTLNVTGPGTYTVRAEYCPDACPDSTDFTITVSPTDSDLSISKVAASPTTAPGGQVSYTITIDNGGPDPASNLVMDDTLPATLGFASISTPAGWNCSTPAVGASGTVSCQKNSMLANGSSAITLVANVSGSASIGSTISNTATVSTAFDSNSANNSATATVAVAASAPAMTVTKVLTGTVDNDSSGSVSAGDRLDYQVTAKNTGTGTLTNVVVTDDHFSATQTCPTLAVNGTCILTGSYVVTAADVTAGSVTNIGKGTSSEVPGPISSSVITPITDIEPVTLGVGTGDGQSTPVNTPFPQPLTVVAGGAPPPSTTDKHKSGLQALAQPNVTINWQVMSGSASLQSPTSVTNASGVASMNVSAGPNPGPVDIRASRADDSSVYVEFHLTVTAESPKLGDLPGLDANQQALADVLDGICSGSPSGGGGGETSSSLTASATSSSGYSDLLARCDDLIAAIATDPEGVIGALNQLFADIALVQSESSLLAAQSQFDNIKARIAALRSGTNGTSFGGLAFRNNSGSLPIGAMFQGLFAQDPAPEASGTPKEVGTDFSRWGFFASGTIGRGNADAGSLSPEYDFDIDGLTVGADYRKSDSLIFGGTLGYTRQTNDLASERGDLETKGWSASAYGTWYRQNSWYLDGVLSWGQNSYDIERHVRYVITTPSGQTTIDNSGHGSGDGDSLTFALSVGRDFNKGGWGFGPYLRAMYTKMDFDTIEEHFDETIPGNGLALELDTRSVTSLTSTLGGKLTYAHSTSWGVLIPHLQLEWQHEFEDDPAEVEMRFLFDPTATPFQIQGDAIDSDFFRFGVGMSFVMTKGRSGFFYYERLISRERFTQNSLALGIRLEF